MRSIRALPLVLRKPLAQLVFLRADHVLRRQWDPDGPEAVELKRRGNRGMQLRLGPCGATSFASVTSAHRPLGGY